MDILQKINWYLIKPELSDKQITKIFNQNLEKNVLKWFWKNNYSIKIVEEEKLLLFEVGDKVCLKQKPNYWGIVHKVLPNKWVMVYLRAKYHLPCYITHINKDEWKLCVDKLPSIEDQHIWQLEDLI